MKNTYMKLVILIFVSIVMVSCKSESSLRSKQSEAMYAEKINCPENSHVEYAPWGETGWVKVCKQNNGKYVVWVGEIKKIDGEFFNDKKTGVWTYYRDDGSIEKTVNYGKDSQLKGE